MSLIIAIPFGTWEICHCETRRDNLTIACLSALPSGLPKASIMTSTIFCCTSSSGNLVSNSSTMVFRLSGLVGRRLAIIRTSALVSLNSRSLANKFEIVSSLYGNGLEPRGDGAASRYSISYSRVSFHAANSRLQISGLFTSLTTVLRFWGLWPFLSLAVSVKLIKCLWTS